MSKLRRQRRFGRDGSIHTQLPTPAAPQSRLVPDPTTPGEGLLLEAALPSSAPLEAVLDRVVCGDARGTLARLPSGWATCAVTSPPYWNLVDYGFPGQIGCGSYGEYRERLGEVWRHVARCLAPNGKLCLNVPLMPLRKAVSAEQFEPTHTRWLLDLPGDLKADVLARTDLLFFSLYVWEKQTTEKMFGSYPHPPNLYERNYIEFILVFVKPGPPPRRPREVKDAARLTQEEWLDLTKQIWWIYPENVRRKEGHPAPFPEALPNRLISMYTFPRVASAGFAGDVVLDPFAGWGTTCVAAKRLGRRYVGVDGSPGFCEVAAERLAGTDCAPRVMTTGRP